MSTAVIFDTHAYVKKLRDAGVDERQAEVQADALVSLVEDRLATKKDLSEVETNLKRDMKEMELRMVIKMGAMILASVGLIIGFLRAFPMPVQIVHQSTTQEIRQTAPVPAPSPALPAPSPAPAH